MVRDWDSECRWSRKQVRHQMYGKGSVRRKTDEEKYRENYDKIFGKKELKDGKLQPKEEQEPKE